MATWSDRQPCPNCGKKHTLKCRCTVCGTTGCDKCVGGPGGTFCKVCGKTTRSERLPG